MPNLRILQANRYDAVATTLTASSSATALPVATSQNPDRTAVWRSATATSVQTIDIDLGSVLPVSAVAVANVRLLGAGALELRERGDSGSPGTATTVVTLPAQDRDTRTAFAFFTEASHRHWQLRWTNPTSASDYAELGVAFLGVPTELGRNVRVPADVKRVDPSVVSTSVDGQQTRAARTKFYAGAWAFEDITEAQLDDLRTLFDALGAGGAHFAVLDAAIEWTCWYQRITGELGASFNAGPGLFNAAFGWEEAR